MKHFTILGGVNGVGKSTLAGVLAGVTDNFGTLVDADKLTARCGGASQSASTTLCAYCRLWTRLCFSITKTALYASRNTVTESLP